MQQAVVLLDRIISRGLDPAVVLEIFIIQLGWIIALAIPMAILTSTLMTFGRMSGDNEITSIKASGRNLYSLLVPVFAAATTIAVLLVFFNDMILPDANHRTANLLSDISRTRPAAFIEPRVLIKDFPDYTLYIDDVNYRSGILEGIRISADIPGQNPSTTVAAKGTIRMTRDEGYYELVLFDGETHSTSKENTNEYYIGRFTKQTFYIKNIDSQLRRTNSSYRSDREKSSSMMLADVAEIEKTNEGLYSEYHSILDTLKSHVAELDSLESAITTSAITKDNLPDFKKWVAQLPVEKSEAIQKINGNTEHLERLLRRINSNKMLISKYMVEVHKKFAIPVACIIFVLIGAPLGIMARRGGLAVASSYSVFFFIIYWACLIGGETLADKMIIPPGIAMWAGNAIIGVCGIILIILMIRETTIRFDFLILWWQKMFNDKSEYMRHIRSSFMFAIPRFILKLPRYLFRKTIGTLPTYTIGIFLGYSAGILLALIVIYVVIDYVSNLKRFEHGTMYDVVLFYTYYLPWIVQTFSPVVLLLASMFSMGKLAKNSELTAMKAAGINIRQLTIPLLIFAIMFSVAAFYLGEWIIPQVNTFRREILVKMENGDTQVPNQAKAGTREFRHDFYYFGTPTTLYHFREFSTYPQRAVDIWRDNWNESRLAERIKAASMEYDSTGWKFINGSIRSFGGDTSSLHYFDTLSDTVLQVSPSTMVARIKVKEEMSYWELASFIETAKRRGENVDKYAAELDFKLAFPFMNFIVILLGVAITARTGRKGNPVLFGIGLLITFSYWLISRFSLVFAQNGHIPNLVAAWFSNGVFLLLGLFLYRKASR